MIYIFQDDETMNISIDEVADWLYFYGHPYKYISGNHFFSNKKDFHIALSNDEQEFYSDHITPGELENTGSVWFRGFLRYRNHTRKVVEGLESTNDNIGELKSRCIIAIRKINSLIFKEFDNKFQLPKIKSLKIDKVKTLQLACTCGINIPNSILTNSKKSLKEFYQKYNKKIITKSLYETVYFQEENSLLFFKTTMIEEGNWEKIPELFFPSFFQEYIEKEYELRIFYLDKRFYSMAIFSQLDEQTEVDFRRYNDERPNRSVPYQLPKKIEDKLNILMEKLDLNTGSIDMIKTKKGEYVFLEVNPTGQFGMTSKPCNYYLEDEIAKILIDNDTKRE